MARDPVCGMYVDEDTAAFKTAADGKTYYFCSEQCLRTFTQPEIEEEKFTEHVETVLKSWKPFPIHIEGFTKSWDHLLLLLLREKAKENI